LLFALISVRGVNLSHSGMSYPIPVGRSQVSVTRTRPLVPVENTTLLTNILADNLSESRNYHYTRP